MKLYSLAVVPMIVGYFVSYMFLTPMVTSIEKTLKGERENGKKIEKVEKVEEKK